MQSSDTLSDVQCTVHIIIWYINLRFLFCIMYNLYTRQWLGGREIKLESKTLSNKLKVSTAYCIVHTNILRATLFWVKTIWQRLAYCRPPTLALRVFTNLSWGESFQTSNTKYELIMRKKERETKKKGKMGRKKAGGEEKGVLGESGMKKYWEENCAEEEEEEKENTKKKGICLRRNQIGEWEDLIRKSRWRWRRRWGKDKRVKKEYKE